VILIPGKQQFCFEFSDVVSKNERKKQILRALILLANPFLIYNQFCEPVF
jgi:hypothetical protein